MERETSPPMCQVQEFDSIDDCGGSGEQVPRYKRLRTAQAPTEGIIDGLGQGRQPCRVELRLHTLDRVEWHHRHIRPLHTFHLTFCLAWATCVRLRRYSRS